MIVRARGLYPGLACFYQQTGASRKGNTATAIAVRLILTFPAAAQINPFTGLDFETDRYLLTALMMAIAKWQAPGLATGTTIIDSRFQGKYNRHPGISIH